MTLKNLLGSIPVKRIVGDCNVEITALTADSRRAAAGCMFVAVRGVTVDGHSFIPSLAGKGVAAMVVEQLPESMEEGTTYVVVENSAVALGCLASRWYGEPSKKLRLVGVTGTNGKTTTATLIYEMARLMGFRAGLLSTVVNKIDDEDVHAEQTTPDPLTINALLARMVERGCTYAAMEVSSHAAHQHRIGGLQFAGGVFTNLTRDHLDYHKTVQAYLSAKKSFFDGLAPEAFALTNADDRNGAVMLQNTVAKKYTYALRTPADFHCKIIDSRLDGTTLQLNGHQVEVLFTGRFNAYNLTAVYGASILLGWDPQKVLVAMSSLVPVAGRFQTFRSPKGDVTAIVDYAHTPDAVENVITAIRGVIGQGEAAKGRIITVVGAGGNRDKGKRPIMAQVAARLSDMVILTSDNPRFEKPEDILADMVEGVKGDAALQEHTLTEVDRRTAIARAVLMASPGDVILIAGKGHEDYQEVCGVKHHFDDREVVTQALACR